eukprot:s4312_g6.t1
MHTRPADFFLGPYFELEFLHSMPFVELVVEGAGQHVTLKVLNFIIRASILDLASVRAEIQVESWVLSRRSSFMEVFMLSPYFSRRFGWLARQ